MFTVDYDGHVLFTVGSHERPGRGSPPTAYDTRPPLTSSPL